MGRRRVYASPAERQKAHRQRQAADQEIRVSPRERRQRPLSRPARLAHLVDETQALLEEYQEWLDRLPIAFEGTTLHERLTEAVERLGVAFEALEDIDPPRGFGRD